MEVASLYYQAPPESVEGVYHTPNPPTPKGYKVVSFRPVAQGECFLSTIDAMRGGTKASFATSCGVPKPRLILERIEEAPITPSFDRSVLDVYGCIPRIPNGYRYVTYREPSPGEQYLAAGTDQYMDPPVLVYTIGGTMAPLVSRKRIIVVNCGAPSTPTVKAIRVVRVLEYVGPEAWIDSTMSNNAVGFDGPQVVRNGKPTGWALPEGKSIRQLSIFKEEVK